MCTLVQGHILLSRRFAKQFERQVNVRENAHNLYILVPAIRLSFGAVPCSRRPWGTDQLFPCDDSSLWLYCNSIFFLQSSKQLLLYLSLSPFLGNLAWEIRLAIPFLTILSLSLCYSFLAFVPSVARSFLSVCSAKGWLLLYFYLSICCHLRTDFLSFRPSSLFTVNPATSPLPPSPFLPSPHSPDLPDSPGREPWRWSRSWVRRPAARPPASRRTPAPPRTRRRCTEASCCWCALACKGKKESGNSFTRTINWRYGDLQWEEIEKGHLPALNDNVN